MFETEQEAVWTECVVVVIADINKFLNISRIAKVLKMRNTKKIIS